MAYLPELACCTALVAAALALRPDMQPRRTLPLLGAAVGLLWVAVGAVTIALLREDTSLRYVVEQTRPGTAWTRRLTGLWSGAEGSLLLYVAIVAAVLLTGHRTAPRWQRGGSGLIIAVLAGAVAWGADPFERVALPPPGGIGMAPILEHGAMLVHPPLLYLGTALSLAPALVRDAGRARRLVHGALGLMSVSLALGASWAYVELGWGGWWAWDPIENVGLVVWLLLAGALHGDRLEAGAQRPGTDSGLGSIGWLAACWPAVFAGAALTRTSLRTSVHAFADATELSIWLWPLVVIAAVGGVVRVREVRVGEAGRVATRWPQWAPVVLIAAATVVVALGTWRPFVGGDGTEGWFYSRALFPVAVMAAVLLGAAPVLARTKGSPFGSRLVVTAAVAGGVAGLLVVVGVGATSWYQVVFAAALGAGAVPLLIDARRAPRRSAAHAGVALVLLGALGATAGSDALVGLGQGDSTSVAGHDIALRRVDVVQGEPTIVTAAVVVDGAAELEPSVARYASRNLRLPEIATHSRPWHDVQVILRDVADDGTASLTVRIRPATQLVWWGAGLLTLVGLAGFVRPVGRRQAGPLPAVAFRPQEFFHR